MNFADLFFLYVFMAVCFIAYFVCKKTVYRNIVLILFSLVFYAWGEPVWVFLLVIGATLNYFAGILIDKFKGTKAAAGVMAGMLIIDLGGLVCFKYTGFFVASLNDLLSSDIPVPDIRVPIGIGLFTLRAVSYIIDCYRGTIIPQKSWYKLLMYISMFPQLVAGPVVRYSEIENEIDNRVITFEDISEGITRICMGLGKKVILANNLGLIVDGFFKGDALNSLTVVGTWYTVILYAMQVYFEFSGFSDIAIGLGRIFGFRFKENFNYPFICRNISDFWKRWYISVGEFFRDYLLYIPVLGKRRKYVNLFLICLLTGLWYGAGKNYIIWGIYFGVFIFIERLIGLKRLKRIPAVIAHIYSKLVLAVGFGIFYFTDITRLGRFMGNLVGASGNSFIDRITTKAITENLWLVLVALLFCLPVIPWLRKKLEKAGHSLAVSCVQTVCNIAVFAVSSILLVNPAYNPLMLGLF